MSLQDRVDELEEREIKRKRNYDLAQRLESLRRDGYTGSQHDPKDARQMKGATCESCNRLGLRYFAKVRPHPWALVSFGECGSCGWVLEF